MHTFQLNSHINENGILSVKLPEEWAEKDVNVVLILESLQHKKESRPLLSDSQQAKERLKKALDYAASLNIFEGEDGVAWQNEQRRDRTIGYDE